MPETRDPHDLRRFVEAQDPVWDRVMDELDAGQKRTHWIWFVFPQVEGLGSSPTAQRYATLSRAEAAAYLDHPTLRARLDAATREMLRHGEATSAEGILGGLDAKKFQSSMTLFEALADDPSLFARALERFADGRRCTHTRRWLGAA
ncbi:MAG: DUF1810 domain-containing protein [Paracoccaceae bacterium]